MAAKIRKGDKVMVLSGRDKGRTGEVIEVRRGEDVAETIERVAAERKLREHADTLQRYHDEREAENAQLTAQIQRLTGANSELQATIDRMKLEHRGHHENH